ncbi:MAG TPA: 50S ribosomal protein L22 [Chlamydiales bacterium]|nr:50S ribosomal protein L22 [Chlamydiales bacterium]
MQNAKAKSRYVRIAPRKARLAAGLVRGMSVENANVQLLNSPLKGARLLKKTLDSAVANAETQLDVRKSDLFIQEIRVDAGPILKRSKSKSRGGRMPVMKRTSHFTIVLTTEQSRS